MDIQQMIAERLAAIQTSLSEEVRSLIATELAAGLAGLADNEEFTRKLRFGGDSLTRGSEYARWGLGTEDIWFLHALMDGSRGLKIENGIHPGVSERLSNAHKRAMDTAESGFGSQLVGAQYLGQLWEAARAESRIFGLINSFPMTAPTANLPVEVDIPEMLFVGESTANNSSNYSTVKTGSQKVAVTASKFVIHQMWSGEMEEDSIIPFVPFLRRQAQLAIAHYSDSLALNGDTTNAATGNINLDDADPADTKHYLAFDGIRHAGLVDNTANSLDLAGGISLTALSKARGRMIDAARFVDWGHPRDMNDLIYAADPETTDAISMLDECLTVDKFGPGATILNGQIGRILGHPVISSLAISKTEADGKVSTTGGNNIKGQVVTFNRRGFVVGDRRDLKVEVERLPGSDQWRHVYSKRMGFGRFTPTGAASGIEAADVIYDISL